MKLEDEREARDRDTRQLRARLETLEEELQIEREGYNKTTHVSGQWEELEVRGCVVCIFSSG